MQHPAHLRLRLFALALLAAYGAHLLLAGKLWAWNLFSPIPPLLFVLVPLLLLAYSTWKHEALSALVALLLLGLGWTQADIHPGVLTRDSGPAAGPTLSVFTWNTRYWNEEGGADFYAFLRAQDADVCQLQEYWDRNGNGLALQDELTREFPAYAVFTSGELVTLVRAPLRASVVTEHPSFLRVDVAHEGGTRSFYNVHIPMQLGRDMPGIFARRAAAFTALEEDIAGNPQPLFVAGDFNSTTAMGVMGPLLRRLDDAADAGSSVVPTTWGFHFLPWLRLWRIDFALTDAQLPARAYRTVDPGGRSDHWGLAVTVDG